MAQGDWLSVIGPSTRNEQCDSVANYHPEYPLQIWLAYAKVIWAQGYQMLVALVGDCRLRWTLEASSSREIARPNYFEPVSRIMRFSASIIGEVEPTKGTEKLLEAVAALSTMFSVSAVSYDQDHYVNRTM
ncbi:MAG: hypothetical protein M1835_001209 [Candelina submexicana]|nr:MAG: hypothetical protein M1835_001209 [Candelina submexicana]